MLWEHEPQVSVSTAFLSSPKLSQVFLLLDRNREDMFFLNFFKKASQQEKGKQLLNFDYQNVNSLCSSLRQQLLLVLCLQ